jgi:hypothetical protein
MILLKIFAAALLSAAAYAAENPLAGKWSCTNLSDTGSQAAWTLLVQHNDGKLTGVLTDGEAQIPLSEMKLDGSAFTFKFYINEKPFTFAGKAAAGTIEGKYSGEEATGKLRCEKPAS